MDELLVVVVDDDEELEELLLLLLSLDDLLDLEFLLLFDDDGTVRKGAVKVMDFGIAKVVQQMTQTHTQSVGTLQYMSPEQIDARQVDARSDLYSLGLVIYEMLTGAPPFTSPSPRELLNLQLTNARERSLVYDEHYVTVDFTGWRYCEFLLRERDAHRG